MLQFRDVDYCMNVKEPAILFSREVRGRIKHGEYEDMVNMQQFMRQRYQEAGHAQMADDLEVLKLPKDQELLDELFQSSGQLAAFIDEYLEKK